MAARPAGEAEGSGLLDRLKAELRQAARDAEPAAAETLHRFVVQTFEHEPGIG